MNGKGCFIILLLLRLFITIDACFHRSNPSEPNTNSITSETVVIKRLEFSANYSPQPIDQDETASPIIIENCTLADKIAKRCSADNSDCRVRITSNGTHEIRNIYCVCHQGWTGQTCHLPAQESTQSGAGMVLIIVGAITALIIFIFVLIVMGYFYYRKKKTSRTRSGQNISEVVEQEHMIDCNSPKTTK